MRLQVFNGRDVFVLVLFFFFHNNFFHKLPLPGFLVGTTAGFLVVTMAKSLAVTLSSGALNSFNDKIFSRGCIMPGMVVRSESRSLTLETLDLVSSSDSIWSSKDRFFFITFRGAGIGFVFVVVMVVVDVVLIGCAAITLSKRDASFGRANDLSCFPRLRMVSWHSANFSEAAVISKSCRI